MRTVPCGRLGGIQRRGREVGPCWTEAFIESCLASVREVKEVYQCPIRLSLALPAAGESIGSVARSSKAFADPFFPWVSMGKRKSVDV